jgi:AcrR family transcriptional regulator
VADKSSPTASTPDRILDAACEEFQRRGYDGTRIEHIARRAGVSKQMVYHYFKNKDELYGELTRLVAKSSYEALLKIDFASLAPTDAIRAYIAGVFEQYTHRKLTAMLTIDQTLHGGAQVRSNHEVQRMRRQLWTQLSEALDRGKKEGTLRDDVDVARLDFMVTIIVSGCVSGRPMFLRFLGFDSPEDEPPSWEDYATAFVMHALRP